MATTKKIAPKKSGVKKSGVKRTTPTKKKSSNLKSLKAGTGYVLRKSTRHVTLEPKHKEWYTHGPGKATIVETRRVRKKPSWLKPWQWTKPLLNRKVTVTRRAKTTANHTKEAVAKYRRSTAQRNLANLRLKKWIGMPVNSTREYKLFYNGRAPYSARINAAY